MGLAIKPWSWIHIDHADPYLGKLYFIVVDAHSKWIEAQIVSLTSAAKALAVLCQVFSVHRCLTMGVPSLVQNLNNSFGSM